MSVFSDIKKAFKRIGKLDDELEDAFKQLADIQRARKWAGGRINSIDKTMENLPEYVEKQAKAAATDVLDAAVNWTSGEVFALAAKAARVVDRELTAFEKNEPTLVNSLNGVGFDLDLNVVTLHYGNFYTRSANVVSILDRYANSPPAWSRKAILQAVEALGPDAVGIGFKVPIVLVGVNVGGLDMPLFLAIADKVLRETGVPE